jgi:hypothetical protein
MLTRSVYVGLHKDTDTTNTIKLYFLIFVVAPVTHSTHVVSPGVILTVAW